MTATTTKPVASTQPGNSKLGKVPNISLMPGRTCNPDAPCRKLCYAVKALRRPCVKACWTRNTDNAMGYRKDYFAEIDDYCSSRRPPLFRWHVAGDIPDQDYLDRMAMLAHANPGTEFLCFTKQHKLDFRYLPDNLHIVFSMWPGWGRVDYHDYRCKFPRAWMQDGTENRIGQDGRTAVVCPGVTRGEHCDTCGMCWALDSSDNPVDIIFPKH